jgi:hypothetical protein
MSVISVLTQSLDPMSAVIVGLLWIYLRRRLNTLEDRLNRLEDTHIADGGQPNDTE